jgi:hypothetical protein
LTLLFAFCKIFLLGYHCIKAIEKTWEKIVGNAIEKVCCIVLILMNFKQNLDGISQVFQQGLTINATWETL